MDFFGTTPDGRLMPYIYLSKSGSDPRFRGGLGPRQRPLLLVQNGIHSGEIEGKDASLILARSIVFSPNDDPPPMAHLLDKVDVLIVPIFSIDAHERRSKFNRANQNGPEEMGWRVTNQNFNLNRDYIKCDAGEMRAMVGLIRDTRPDFFIDNHTTNGGEWQYTLMHDVPTGPHLDPGVSAISSKYKLDVMPMVERDGYLTAPYFGGFNYRNPMSGITINSFGPRYSTGYLSARNRPSLLVETHVLKPYKPRLFSTLSIMVHTLEWMNKNAAELIAVNDAADAANRLWKEGDDVVLSSRTSRDSRPFTFKGFEYIPYQSEISGGEIPKWDLTKPIDVPSVIRDQFEASLSVRLPSAYFVPEHLVDVVDRLKLHGIEMREVRLGKPHQLDWEMLEFTDVKFGSGSFEGRFMPTFGLRPVQRKVQVYSGYIVPINQTLGRLVAHMLEPSAGDSLASWGFFNGFFESKEGAEAYAMEPFARKMLAENPQLKAEFEEALKNEDFAKNPGARLRWFYERSPYYDHRLNIYPIARLSGGQVAELLSLN
ncbi:M14 family metallopeptidase [Kamptonema cortianum]|nr:M14 family metallopeptidase [Geitlerinema splendidum]MDK3155303.1 M14 family metallopeptidase [Kamptonema cortianum]